MEALDGALGTMKYRRATREARALEDGDERQEARGYKMRGRGKKMNARGARE